MCKSSPCVLAGFTFSFKTRVQVDVLRQKTMSVANHCEERIRYLEEQPATPPPSSPQKHKTAPKTPPKYSSDDAAPHDQYTDCSTPVSKEQPTTPGPFTQEKLKPLPPINSFDENDNNTVNRRRVSMSSFCKPTEASTKKQQKPVNAVPTPQKSARPSPFKVRLFIPPPSNLTLINSITSIIRWLTGHALNRLHKPSLPPLHLPKVLEANPRLPDAEGTSFPPPPHPKII